MADSRIKLTDTMQSAATKMAEANPGALDVVLRCLTEGGKIDPDAAMGGMSVLLSMDTLHIYGSRVWMLYKDVCGQDLRVMIAVLRAWQLGFVSDIAINRAIDNFYGDGIDVAALVAKVEERLPKFQKAPAAV